MSFEAGSSTFYVDVPYHYRSISTQHGSVTVKEVTQESIPVHVSIICEDDVFQRAARDCARHVERLSAAVTAMSAAQTAEIYETGEEVSDAVTTGFFNLVKSEISQQIMELENRFEALLGAILENSNMMTQQRKIMERDYQRISGRYANLFQDLDDALKHRIRTLDAPAFDINEAAQKLFVHRCSMSGAAGSAISAAEDPSIQNMIEIATLRKRILNSIEGISEVLNQEKVYEHYMDAVQFNEAISEAKYKYAPVMTFTASKLDAAEEYSGYQAPDYLSDTLGNAIGNKVFLETQNVENRMTEAEAQKLDAYFNAESEKWISQTSNEETVKNHRILETLNNLWKQNPLT